MRNSPPGIATRSFGLIFQFLLFSVLVARQRRLRYPDDYTFMTDDSEQIETIAEPISAVHHRIPPVLNERFPPGALLASRYRIISRLGKGGMGEVFRADDLILRQPVALKFLPESAG